jgi:hypothetical protein
MVVDCDSCAVAGRGCAGCVVTVLVGPAPVRVEFDDEELRALRVMAQAGLVPPLRYRVALPGPLIDPSDLPIGYLPVEVADDRPTEVNLPSRHRRPRRAA